MNKLNARKVTMGGETFDSKKEYARWCELKMLQRAGKISNLLRQQKFVLIPAQRENGKVVERECSYIADFVYYDAATGKTVVEDVKGMRVTNNAIYQIFVIKRKLMLERYGIKIKEV